MIIHKTYEYVNSIRFSKRLCNPVGKDVSIYQCTVIKPLSDACFERTLHFLNSRKCVKKDHPKRPVYYSVGGFHKISVDIKNQKLYCSKHISKKRHNILVGDMF